MVEKLVSAFTKTETSSSTIIYRYVILYQAYIKISPDDAT